MTNTDSRALAAPAEQGAPRYAAIVAGLGATDSSTHHAERLHSGVAALLARYYAESGEFESVVGRRRALRDALARGASDDME